MRESKENVPAYDQWKLQWIQDHRMGFSDICKLVDKYISETVSEAKALGDDPLEALEKNSFGEYVEDNGFSGMLWPCLEEWTATEGEGKIFASAMKVKYFHYQAEETGANETFVAVKYYVNSGILSVTGLEYSEDYGYIYFIFDDCFDPEIVLEEDVFDKDSLLEYLLYSDTRGFSSAWYSKVKDVEAKYPDDDLLGMLLNEYADAFADKDGASEADFEVSKNEAEEKGMSINLPFSN